MTRTIRMLLLALSTVTATSLIATLPNDENPQLNDISTINDIVSVDEALKEEVQQEQAIFDLENITKRTQDFKQNVIVELQNKAQSGDLPVLFEYEKARIAAVLERANAHVDALLEATQQNTERVAPLLLEILDMYDGLGMRVSTMLRNDAAVVREQASQASERLRHTTVRGHDDATLTAIAVHNAVIRAIHPEAFSNGSATKRFKRMWRKAGTGKKVGTGLGIAAGLLTVAGLAVYAIIQSQASSARPDGEAAKTQLLKSANGGGSGAGGSGEVVMRDVPLAQTLNEALAKVNADYPLVRTRTIENRFTRGHKVTSRSKLSGVVEILGKGIKQEPPVVNIQDLQKHIANENIELQKLIRSCEKAKNKKAFEKNLAFLAQARDELLAANYIAKWLISNKHVKAAQLKVADVPELPVWQEAADKKDNKE